MDSRKEIEGTSWVRPTVSVIIPTLNRKKVLHDTLRCLGGQRRKPDEVIIVDQSDEPLRTSDFTNLQLALKFVHTSIKGLPRARNIGVKESTADIVLFIDDNVLIADQGFIQAHIRCHAKKETDIVAGRIIQPWNAKEGKKKLYWMNNFLISSGHFNVPQFGRTNGIGGGNFSCRRRVYEALGGFDDNYTGTAIFEETDFAIRAIRSGYHIHYEPQAVLRHLAIPAGGVRDAKPDEIKKMYWFYHNYTYFFLKHSTKLYQKIVIVLYLLLRGMYHVNKYKRIDFFSQGCIKGMRDGRKYFTKMV